MRAPARVCARRSFARPPARPRARSVVVVVVVVVVVAAAAAARRPPLLSAHAALANETLRPSPPPRFCRLFVAWCRDGRRRRQLADYCRRIVLAQAKRSRARAYLISIRRCKQIGRANRF